MLNILHLRSTRHVHYNPFVYANINRESHESQGTEVNDATTAVM